MLSFCSKLPIQFVTAVDQICALQQIILYRHQLEKSVCTILLLGTSRRSLRATVHETNMLDCACDGNFKLLCFFFVVFGTKLSQININTQKMPAYNIYMYNVMQLISTAV